MKKHNLVSKYLIKTFASYILAVTIQIIVLTIIYTSSIYPSAREEQYNIYIKKMQEDANKMGDLFDRIYNYVLLLNSTNEIKNIKKSAYEEELYSYSLMRDNLKVFQINNKSIEKVNLFINYTDKIISSDGKVYDVQGLEYKEVLHTFIRHNERTKYYKIGDRVLFFTVLNNINYDNSIIVMFEISIKELFKNDIFDNLVIISPEQKMLFSEIEDIQGIELDELTYEADGQVIINNKKSNILTYVVDGASGLILLRLHEKNNIDTIYRKSIYYAIAIIVSVFLVSVIISYFFAKSQVKPIKKLSTKLKLTDEDSFETESEITNIFDGIEISLKKLEDANEGYLKRIEENRSIIKEELIRELLWGRSNVHGALNEYFDNIDLGINKKYKNYIALLIKTGENIPSNAPIETSEINVIVKSIIEKHITHELNVVGSAIIELNQIVYLLGVEVDTIDIAFENKIKRINDLVSHMVYENSHIHIRTIISYPINNVEELCNTFIRLRKLINNTNIKEKKLLFLRKNTNQGEKYINYYQANLVQNILSGQITLVNEKLKEIFALNVGIHEDGRKSNFAMLIISNAASSLLDSTDYLKDDCISIIDILYESVSYQEKCHRITNKIVEMTAKCKENSLRNDNNAYIFNAVEYINKNYKREIDLTEIADYIGINTSYFSRIFKSDLNMTPLQYITMLRINKAKELLLESSITIKEIASKVGYQDSRSFIRFFKKIENCTPGEYRKKINT